MGETKLAPWQHDVPIVNPDGTPDPYFIQWFNQLLEEKGLLDNQAEQTAGVDVVAGTGLTLVGGGPVIGPDDIELALNASIDDLNDVDTTTTAPNDQDVLTWINANSQWEPAAPSGGGGGGDGHWHRLAVYNPAAAGQVDITIPANASAVKLVCALATSNDGVELRARVTTDSFGTVKSGVSDYKYSEGRLFSANSDANTTSEAADHIRLATNIGNVAVEEFMGEVTVFGAGNSSFPTSLTTHHTRQNSSGILNVGYGGGRYVTANAVNGIRLYPSAGTITGVVYVYVMSTEDAAGGGGGAWSLIESLTPSAVASINSEAWVGGTYKELMFVFRLTVSSDGSTLSVQYKLNGAYKNAANYRYSGDSKSSSGSSTVNSAQTGTSLTIGNTGATWGIGNASLEHIGGRCNIVKPFETTKPKVLTFQTEHGAPSGAYVATLGGGTYDGTDAAAALEGIQFAISAGTITGTIDVYGLA